MRERLCPGVQVSGFRLFALGVWGKAECVYLPLISQITQIGPMGHDSLYAYSKIALRKLSLCVLLCFLLCLCGEKERKVGDRALKKKTTIGLS